MFLRSGLPFSVEMKYLGLELLIGVVTTETPNTLCILLKKRRF